MTPGHDGAPCDSRSGGDLIERAVGLLARGSHLAFAVPVAAVVALFRLPVFFIRPLNVDELYYAVGATRLLAGGLFYRDVVDHKAPGIYWIYAGLFRWSGIARLGVVHAALLVVVTATALLIAVIGERLFDRRTGRAAGLIYAVVSGIGPSGDFLAANCELFMCLPAMAALALSLSPAAETESPGRAVPRLALVGLLAAAAALVKFQGAAIGLPIVVHLALARRAGSPLRHSLPLRLPLPLRLVTLVLAGLAPFVVLVLGYAAAGSLGDLWWAVRYGATTFVSAVDAGQKVVNGVRNSLLLGLMYAPLLGAAVAFAMRERRGDRCARRRLSVLAAWLAGAFIAVCAGGRFYPHYYIQLLPPLALLAGGFVAAGQRRESSRRPAT